MIAAARPQHWRLAVGARIFGLLILCGPAVVARDDDALLALLSIGVVWTTATSFERLGLNTALVSTVEAAVIGTVCALSLHTYAPVLGALAVTPFTAGLRDGPRSVALALSAELTTLVPIALLLRGAMDVDQGAGTFTWVVTGLGLGLIGSFVRSTAQAQPDPLAPYREAQALLRGLLDISSGLTSGLDAESVGAEIAAAVRDELPVASLAVFLPRGDGMAPLLDEGEPDPAGAPAIADVTRECAGSLRTARAGQAFAFPLATEFGLVAVVAGRFSPGLDSVTMDLDQSLVQLAARLGPHALRLDTALLFAALRDAATADERRRVAREIHDGVAQDIAGLGYRVDALLSRSGSPEQAEQLRVLREQITAVVAEVRRSVQTLRSQVGSNQSLGAAISTIARHLGDSSGIPIQVTADESTARLRPEIEAELLRIVQEAMTNAVRHSRASRIVVRCTVAAPRAEIVVSDDGQGMGGGRSDSHGLAIMRERARLVDAELTIEPSVPHGTEVTVRLPSSGVVSTESGIGNGKVIA